MPVKKNESYICDVSGTTVEGSGVCKVDNFAVFIPDCAVGDEIKFKVVKCLKNYAFGKLEQVITPSPDRINVDCETYKQCGGCVYRHISYEAELKLKQDLVANNFLRIGHILTDCDEIIGSKQSERYRNKAQYPIGIDDKGNAVCGFFAQHSHRIIATNDCALQPKEFAEIQKIVLDFINKNHLSVYDEMSNKGLFRHIYLRKATSTNEIMVCLVITSDKISHEEELVQELIKAIPNVASIIININNKNTNVILGDFCKTIYGKDYISDTICDIKVKLSPLSFYQVNKNQAEILYTLAIEQADLKLTDTLIDLYCGTGTIGLIASKKVNKVIGVEIIDDAIKNAKQNAIDNKINNAEFICADAKSAAKQFVDKKIKPNVIIVDPPRKGLDAEVISAIEDMLPEKIVYISCNPSTAARDCALLCEQHYSVKKITPVDMFPRTSHVECVVLMSRVSK